MTSATDAVRLQLAPPCWSKDGCSSRYDSSEPYRLLASWYDAGGGAVYSDEMVNPNSVPSGSVCK
jgi:hypothetical protein